MHHADFYGVTLREYALISEARVEAVKNEAQVQRIMNQELGTLTSFAFHNPKKMPDLTQQAAKDRGRKKDPGSDLEKLRAGFMRLHFQSTKGR